MSYLPVRNDLYGVEGSARENEACPDGEHVLGSSGRDGTTEAPPSEKEIASTICRFEAQLRLFERILEIRRRASR